MEGKALFIKGSSAFISSSPRGFEKTGVETMDSAMSTQQKFKNSININTKQQQVNVKIFVKQEKDEFLTRNKNKGNVDLYSESPGYQETPFQIKFPKKKL